MLSNNIVTTYRVFKKQDEVDLKLLALNISISSQFMSIFFKSLHFWIFSYNGQGFAFFDFMADALEVISHLMLSILFILIASGWVIKYRDFPEPDVYIPIVLAVSLINLMIVGLGRITDDAYNKFSDFETIPGYFVILIRILLWFWFFL